MRGAFVDQGRLFSYLSPETRVPMSHPLRKIREFVRDVLSELNRSLERLYANEGRPSIPPEQLLSALLLQVFYGIRSERQLMEQLDYNLLYRWFVGLSPDDPVWDATTFTKNRDRLQNGEVFERFMSKLLNHPQVKPLLSDEHFSVDGTLIEAWASQKSFRPKDGSGDADGGANFHGQRRKNDTHASTTDPDSRLYRKAAGREAKLCYMCHDRRSVLGDESFRKHSFHIINQNTACYTCHNSHGSGNTKNLMVFNPAVVSPSNTGLGPQYIPDPVQTKCFLRCHNADHQALGVFRQDGSKALGSW